MTAFDTIATTYDQDFTQSLTGILQRHIVRNYLEKYVDHETPLKILELGCGTGEDTIFLARKGHHVHAIDISEKMIEVARKKSDREKLPGSVTFHVLDMRHLRKSALDRSFDFVFSNFGAMNCLDHAELKSIFQSITGLTSLNGKTIGVMMPRFCVWESFYFLLKGRWKLIFRRNKREGVLANLEGTEVKTWYYSPQDIRKISRKEFNFIRCRPVGFFLPPSYMNPFFSNKRWLLFILSALEKIASQIPFLSRSSDHFIFELKKS